MDNDLFLLSANNQLVTSPGNKPDFATGTPWAELTDSQRAARRELTYNWTKLKCSLEEIAALISEGFTISTWFTGGPSCRYPGCAGKRADCAKYGRHRCNDNFEAAQIFGLDLDHLATTTSDVLNHIVIKEYAFLVYHTSSSKHGAARLRALFALEKPVTKADSAKRLITSMMWKFEGQSDPACSDICRIFYGNENARIELFNPRVLPVAVAWAWVSEYGKFQEAVKDFEKRMREIQGKSSLVGGDLPPSQDAGARRYAHKILESSCDNIRFAASRHDELTRQCMKLWPYVSYGYLDEVETARQIEQAFKQATAGENRSDFKPAWNSAKRKATLRPYFPADWNAKQLAKIGGR